MSGEHNYRLVIRKLLLTGELKPPLGRATVIHIYHDDWCAVYEDGKCNCDPEFQWEHPEK